MTAKIYGQMIKIKAEVEPIAKTRNNQSQGYKFRGIDDVYEALQAIMAKHGVFSLPTVLEDRTEERQTKNGSALIYRVLKIRYDFYADDGSTVSATVIGEGMDSGDKASNKAMSVADKYCLLQAYKIPTVEPKDPENDSPEPAPRVIKKPPVTSEPPIIYDAMNIGHNAALRKVLTPLGIDPRDMPKIAQKLHGKERNEENLNEAIALVRTGYVPPTAKHDPVPDDLGDVPF